MRLRPPRTILLAVAWLLPAWLSGCSHYHLGSGGGTLPFSTLYVAPPSNRTKLPQSRAIIGTLVRQAFLRDGRVDLVDRPDEADATLEIALTDYHREVAASREDDTGLARKFTLFLTASCRLRNNRTGRILFENRIMTAQKESFTDNGLGDVPFGLSNDQLQSEYNELPQLANALADQVTHAVLDVW
jgi:hypothetical protein